MQGNALRDYATFASTEWAKELACKQCVESLVIQKNLPFNASLDSGVQGDFLGTMGQKSLCFQLIPTGYML